MPMTVRDMIKRLKKDGWSQIRQTGSHRHFGHPTKTGTVTVPGHPGDDLTPGTEASIKKQAGLK